MRGSLMSSAMRTIATLLLLGQATLGWAYPWDQDMVDQPSAKPQESPEMPPSNAPKNP